VDLRKCAVAQALGEKHVLSMTRTLKNPTPCAVMEEKPKLAPAFRSKQDQALDKGMFHHQLQKQASLKSKSLNSSLTPPENYFENSNNLCICKMPVLERSD
jgi:hypothetical protein